jgi:superfamily II DNA or RNA helicase
MKCTLIIQDEVNCQFSGLEADFRRRLCSKMKRDIPNARYMPAVRLGRWDGKKEFFYINGSTYVNLLDQILPLIEAEGYDIELVDQRDYQTEFDFEAVTADSFKHALWPADHPAAGQSIQLRDHQVDAINQFLANPQCIQEIATGAGKSILGTVLCQRCEQYGRTIMIVPNKSLVVQTERDYRLLGLDVGVWFGDRKEFGHKHTICTWQSLNVLLKNAKNRLQAESEGLVTIADFIEDVVAVIVDEAHNLTASVLTELLTGPMAKIPIRWALTGTIPKEEFEWWSLLTSIGPVINRIAAAELQEKGILSNCHINIRQLIDHGEYRDYQSELKYLVDNPERMSHIASMIRDIATEGNTLVLVDRLAAGEHLCAELTDAVFVSGKDKVSKRKEHYDSVAISDNKIIVATYGVASTGIDLPRLFNVVLIEPGKSFVRTIQSIGRGLRKGHDKDMVQIWDITSTMKFSKRHLTKRKTYYSDAHYPYTVEKVDWQR